MSGHASKIPHARVREIAEDLLYLGGDQLAGGAVIAAFVATGEIQPGLVDTIAVAVAQCGVLTPGVANKVTVKDATAAISDLVLYVEHHGPRPAMPGGTEWDLRPLD